jgi:hypothetical protein
MIVGKALILAVALKHLKSMCLNELIESNHLSSLPDWERAVSNRTTGHLLLSKLFELLQEFPAVMNNISAES